jgi:hypothetical protein
MFVLGFSGTSIIPLCVVNSLVTFLGNVLVMGEDPWEALSSMAGDKGLLAHTSITLVYRTKEDSVESRCLVRSSPPMRMWGLPLLPCQSTDCRGPSGNVRAEVHRDSRLFQEKARFSCALCGWRSEWVERPSWINEVGPEYPRRFWYRFPIHPTDMASLQSAMVRRCTTQTDEMVVD